MLSAGVGGSAAVGEEFAGAMIRPLEADEFGGPIRTMMRRVWCVYF